MDSPAIYTIGYGKREVDEFIAVLESHSVNFLVDVRSAPFSKFKPAFSRDALDTALRTRGIRYVFMGDLLGGRPAERDCYIDGKVDYERLKATDSFRRGIARLRSAWEQSLRVCLMCSEGRPEDCHRSKLIGEVLEAEALGIRHIDADGNLKTQAAVIQALKRGQMQLFNAPLTSRKRYNVEPP